MEIRETRNVVGAIALVAGMDWPPHAVTMRVLEVDGREIRPEINGDERG
jgi:hypothetical protein